MVRQLRYRGRGHRANDSPLGSAWTSDPSGGTGLGLFNEPTVPATDGVQDLVEYTLPLTDDEGGEFPLQGEIVFLGQSLLASPEFGTFRSVNATTGEFSLVFQQDMSYGEQGRHYEVCIRKNITMPTGPAGQEIFVNPISERLDIATKMDNYQRAR